MSVQFGFNNLKYNNISHSENKNHKNVGFQGLNRYLSKHFIEAGISKVTGKPITAEEAALEAIEKYPKSRRFVGNLPPEWIDKIPKANRRETVQQIQDLFAELAGNLFIEKKNKKFFKNINYKDFPKKLKRILGLNTNIEFIDAGEVGKAYKLEIGNNKYVFKTFHSNLASCLIGRHGKILESSRAPYANKKGCNSFVDFYFGRIATNASKDTFGRKLQRAFTSYFRKAETNPGMDGFILTKYEDATQQLSPQEEIKRLLRILKSPILPLDSNIYLDTWDDRNIIGKKIVDLGWLKLKPQNLYKSLKQTAKTIEKYYFNTKKNSDTMENILEEINKTKSSIKDLNKTLNTLWGIECEFGIKNIKSSLENILERLEELIQNPT